MATEKADSVRSFHICESIPGNALITGDRNLILVAFLKVARPQPDAGDIQAGSEVLLDIPVGLNSSMPAGIAQKWKKEANRCESNKSAVETTIKAGSTCAKKTLGINGGY